jgi:hypothetical protein
MSDPIRDEIRRPVKSLETLIDELLPLARARSRPAPALVRRTGRNVPLRVETPAHADERAFTRPSERECSDAVSGSLSSALRQAARSNQSIARSATAAGASSVMKCAASST